MNGNPAEMRNEWSIPDDVIYLNHGSFGPSPKVVQAARHQWIEQLESQPMHFFLRQMEDAVGVAYECLAKFVGAKPNDLIFVENATAAMNIVAANIELNAGDEVLTTDHEYGAVLRIWRRVCRRAGASLVVRKLPNPMTSADKVIETFMEAVTSRTRLIVISHVTSPTAIILPVAEISRRARELGIPVCIDGPHAVAMLPIDLDQLGCDYYAASGHKWLSAPFGSGFLYVRRSLQQNLQPVITSWGGSVSGRPPSWKDEFDWIGTRDPTAYLSIPIAIQFLQSYGLDEFRNTTHALAQFARQRIQELTGIDAIVSNSADWFGSMISLPLPSREQEPPKKGHRDLLQDELWNHYRIEVPIVHWQGTRFVRVSCHLYNSREDIDALVEVLGIILTR